MKLIYVSHPYSGDEVKNRSEAGKLAANIAKKHPSVLIVNPLDAMRHLKAAKAPYEQILEKCKALLEKCDGIIMMGKWKDSYGCMDEYMHAVSLKMPIWESPEEFDGEEKMLNDCYGNHAECMVCMCGDCAERLACWNCNDCTKEDGQRHPVGYTKEKVWECSRYRRKG